VRQISPEICRLMFRDVFPLYHSIKAPPRGLVVGDRVGDGVPIPDGAHLPSHQPIILIIRLSTNILNRV